MDGSNSAIETLFKSFLCITSFLNTELFMQLFMLSKLSLDNHNIMGSEHCEEAPT